MGRLGSAWWRQLGRRSFFWPRVRILWVWLSLVVGLGLSVLPLFSVLLLSLSILRVRCVLRRFLRWGSVLRVPRSAFFHHQMDPDRPRPAWVLFRTPWKPPTAGDIKSVGIVTSARSRTGNCTRTRSPVLVFVSLRTFALMRM